MLKERSETVTFTRDDLERIARYVSKQQIIGSFIGKFGEQSVRWTADGGIEVITSLQEGDLNDLPPVPVAALASPGKKKKRK